jgi:hypothetical protein
MQQYRPCVLRLIKNQYLQQTTLRSKPYWLNNKVLADPSDGQSKGILRILRNQVKNTTHSNGRTEKNILFFIRLNWEYSNEKHKQKYFKH